MYPTDFLEAYIDPDKTCCVCFKEQPILFSKLLGADTSLADLHNEYFVDDILPNDMLVKCPCSEHYICIRCMRNIVFNFENNPINENSSHLSCPYPFNGGCKSPLGFGYPFEHLHIKKICRNESEWTMYINHAEEFAFPGFMRYKCPNVISMDSDNEEVICNSDILIEHQAIKDTPIGELVVECSQNIKCLKKFCYNCRSCISYFSSMCYTCKFAFEHENPNTYNYFFNKNIDRPITDQINEEQSDNELSFNECDYLFLNRDITPEFAAEYITTVIGDINTHMICPICKVSMFKTEKCNGMSHHNLERCYACSRIGFKIKGLGEHWNPDGIGGCFRFDQESFVKDYAPDYICNELMCSNHYKECNVEEHQTGIAQLEGIRKQAYVYHLLKSLLPEVCLKTYDLLFETHANTPTMLEYLPFKQTLVLLHTYKTRYQDYIEPVVYVKLHLQNPHEVGGAFIQDKSFVIPVEEYIDKYSLPILSDDEKDISSVITYSFNGYTMLLDNASDDWNI